MASPSPAQAIKKACACLLSKSIAQAKPVRKKIRSPQFEVKTRSFVKLKRLFCNFSAVAGVSCRRLRNLFANHQPPLAAVRQGERAGIAVGTAQLFSGRQRKPPQLSIRIRAFHRNEHPANPHKRQAVFAQYRQGGYRTGAGDIKLFTPDFAGGFLCALLGELYPRSGQVPRTGTSKSPPACRWAPSGSAANPA